MHRRHHEIGSNRKVAGKLGRLAHLAFVLSPADLLLSLLFDFSADDELGRSTPQVWVDGFPLSLQLEHFGYVMT